MDLTPAIPITTLLAWRDVETQRWRGLHTRP